MIQYRDFGITRLMVNRYTGGNYSCNCLLVPHIYHSVAVMLEGSGRLTCEGGCTEVKKGDVFFIPLGCHYLSEWSASPETGVVSFYSLHFLLTPTAAFNRCHYPLQKIGFDNVSLLTEKYRLLQEKLAAGQAEGFDALSLFFGILADVTPYLAATSDDSMRERIRPAIDFLSEKYAADVPVGHLAELCLMSRTRFFEAFRRVIGSSPIAYKNELKLAASAGYLLSHPEKSVEAVACEMNFSTPVYFIRQFKRHFGITPCQYRKKSTGHPL